MNEKPIEEDTMRYVLNVQILFIWLLLTLRSTMILAGTPEIISVKKIWDQAPHNAFTDLIRFQDKWYCTFREAQLHAKGEDGKIRVIVSTTGEKWESAGLLSEKGVDLRDPKLSVMPDGRLMLVCGGSIYDKDVYQTRSPRVAFSRDGHNWTSPQKVLAEDHWLWRVTWYKGTAYCVSKLGIGKNPRRVILYSSKDGLEWEWITEFEIPAFPNETTLRFMPDGEMIALMRRNKTGWIGSSHQPYKKWKWHDTKHRLGGPNFIRLPNGEFWAGSRSYQGEVKTVLAKMTRDSYETVLILPSGGDTSYPGMVWHDDILRMSYYSSHEGKTSIYLVKIRFKQ